MQTAPAPSRKALLDACKAFFHLLQAARITAPLVDGDQALLPKHVVEEEAGIRIAAEQARKIGERICMDPGRTGNPGMRKGKKVRRPAVRVHRDDPPEGLEPCGTEHPSGAATKEQKRPSARSMLAVEGVNLLTGRRPARAPAQGPPVPCPSATDRAQASASRPATGRSHAAASQPA